MDTSKSSDRSPNRIWFRTVMVSLVAGSLALPSTSVLAAPPPSDSPTEATVTQEPEVALARSLFEQGLDAYDADDYAGAAKYWTEAHELMAQEPELSAGRRVLGFDLAQAQMRAYAKDQDKSRVTAAKPLLEGYVAWVDRPGHTMDEGEKQDRMRALELLERIEDESSPRPPAPAPELVRPEAPPTPAPPPSEPTPSGTGFLIGGGLALGGGVASVVAAFAMTASGRAAERRYNAGQAAYLSGQEATAEAEIEAANRDGRRANIGLVTAATSALLLGAAGITMLAIGGHRRRRHVSASASLSPGSAATSLSVRF